MAPANTTWGVDLSTLCRVYSAVLVSAVSASQGRDVQDGVVRVLLGWGVLCDEQLFESGVSQCSDCCAGSAHALGADLLARSVERMGVLINGGADEEVPTCFVSLPPQLASSHSMGWHWSWCEPRRDTVARTSPKAWEGFGGRGLERMQRR